MNFTTAVLVLTWVAIGLLGFVVSGLIRQVHQLTSGQRADVGTLGPQEGAPAPAGVFGSRGGRRHLLIFVDSLCPLCSSLPTYAADIAQSRPGTIVALLYHGQAIPLPPKAPVNLVVRPSSTAEFKAYNIGATPYAVVVDEHSQVVVADIVLSGEALGTMLSSSHPEASLL